MRLEEELFDRWQKTGRIGFEKVRTKKQARALIETIVEIYDEQCDENCVTLKELAKDLKKFLY